MPYSNTPVSRLTTIKQAGPAIALATTWLIVGGTLLIVALHPPPTHKSMGSGVPHSDACIKIMQVVLGFTGVVFGLAGALAFSRICLLLIGSRKRGNWMDEWLFEEEDLVVDDEESQLLEEGGVGDIYGSAANVRVDG